MTTAETRFKTDGNGVAVMPVAEDYFVFPDPPERTPDEMTTYDHLNYYGFPYLLRLHFGDQETTIVDSEHYISRVPTQDMTGLRYPDLLIAFDVDPDARFSRNAYVISEQGKPPDFVLEVASKSTGHIDVGAKRVDYAELGVLEYWRFDETGDYHGTRLAGDRLVDGKYEPIEIVEFGDGVLQGYSRALNLHLRWEDGQLAWFDPATEEHIATFESERERADQERARADREWEARLRAETLARRESEARIREQARADALEAELRRLRG